MERKLYKILFLLLIFPILLFSESENYTLGNGYKVPALPIYIGGYLSTQYINNREPKKDTFQINDAALLGYGSYNRFSYLAELEVVNLYKKELDSAKEASSNTDAHIERLYVDYSINEQYLLRVGKFTSPIGYWNITPINVLRDTTSNPVMSYIVYPKYTSGLDLSYEHLNDYETKVDVIAQDNDDIDEKYNNIKVDKHYALGIKITNELISFKLNGGYFHSEPTSGSGQDLYYSVASFLFDNDTLKVSGEIGNQFSNNKTTIPYAMYLQSVYTFHKNHYAIVRLESYKENDNLQNIKDSASIFAYTYRPIYPIAIKAEYQVHSYSELNQFMASFSVLF